MQLTHTHVEYVFHAKSLDHAHLIKTTPIFIVSSQEARGSGCQVVIWCVLFEPGDDKPCIVGAGAWQAHVHKAL